MLAHARCPGISRCMFSRALCVMMLYSWVGFSITKTTPIAVNSLSCGFHRVHDVAGMKPGVFYIIAANEMGQGIFALNKKELSLWKPSDLSAGVLETDPRRGYVFLFSGDGNLTVYPASKYLPQEPRVVDLKMGGAAKDVSFSVIDRKIYVLDPAGQKVLRVNVKALNTEKVLDLSESIPDAASFERVLVSSDGKRLYLAGRSKEGGNFLGTYHLASKSFEKRAVLGFSSPIIGLDLYRNYFVVAGEDPGHIEAIHSRTLSKGQVSMPLDWDFKSSRFVLIADQGMLVPLIAEDQPGQCIRKFKLLIQ